MMEAAAESDEHIAALVQRGNAEAFGMLMDRYEAKLRRYGRTFIANDDDITDIVQDIFVKTYQNINGFRTTERFSPWIYRIAHNAFVNEIRRKQHRPFALPEFDVLLAHVPASDSASSVAEQAEMKRMVDEGLSRVPESYREILSLFYLEELSYKEIADVLAVPVSTVGVRLSRAKQALKKVYHNLHATYGTE